MTDAINAKKINLRHIIAIIFMLLFIFNDLFFDYVLSFKESDFIAFIFTLLSATIVFIGTWKVKKDEGEKAYYKATRFIKSNFDNAQVIFSVLDIVCGLISLFSTYFFLSCTFKIVKIFYIPTKIVVVINKEKSLLKPITKFSFFWSAMRLITKQGGVMVNFLKRNKWTLIIGTLISAFCGFGFYVGFPIFVPSIPHWALILASVGLALLVFGATFFLGNDTVKSFVFRTAKRVLPEEMYNQLAQEFEKAVDAVEQVKKEEKENAKVEATAKKRYNAEKKAEKKAEATTDTKSAKEEFEHRVEAKLRELKAQENRQ